MGPATRCRMASVVLLMSLLGPSAGGQPSEGRASDLFGGFRPGWDADWTVRKLASRPTRFEVVLDSGTRVLRATSNASASALLRLLDVDLADTLELSWRWKVASSLTGNRNERSKDGDDYAARVLVTFGSHTFNRSTRALCYVWAAAEPVGAAFRSPRSDNIATIVLESGNQKSGEWILERRDVLEDYRSAFGRSPDRPPAAVAVIVDTDDTQSSSIAWFDDVRIHEGH
jgi:hypothetical protein